MAQQDIYRDAMRKLIAAGPNSNVITTHLSTADATISTHCILNLINPYLDNKAKKLFTDKNYRINHLIHQRNEKVPLHQSINAEIKDNFMTFIKNLTSNKRTDYEEWSHYVRAVDMVNYFGIQTDAKNLNTAIIRLAAVINSLASRGAITGVLTEPSLMPLFDPKSKTHSIAIMTYLAIHCKKQKRVEKDFKSILFLEGATPPKIK